MYVRACPCMYVFEIVNVTPKILCTSDCMACHIIGRENHVALLVPLGDIDQRLN